MPDDAAKNGGDAVSSSQKAGTGGLEREIATLREALASAHHELHRLRAQRDELLGSSSWRVTKPLRIAKRSGSWLVRGSSAWARFKPGSRPRRMLANALLRLRPTPRRARSVSERDATLQDVEALGFRKHLAEPVPTVEADMADEAWTGDMADLDLGSEPDSVRLALKRVTSARRNLALVSDADLPRSIRLPRLAFVTPMPPARTGIADYSAELVPELAQYYEVDVIVPQTGLELTGYQNYCTIHGLEWFEECARSYDRIVYQIGNSAFHHEMFLLLERFPGTVVLHDFYLGHIVGHLEVTGGWKKYWSRSLLYAHGYGAVKDRFTPEKFGETVLNYPANLRIIQEAHGVIVHSEFSRQLASRFYGDRFPDDWAVVPLARRLPDLSEREVARSELGLADDEVLVCSFGILQETKLNRRLLDAWLASKAATELRCRLVFVGEPSPGEYCDALRRIIAASPARDRIGITGFAAPDLYRRYLLAADVAVQLRATTRGETSAAVFDCMGHGLPTIVNAHGPMAALPSDAVSLLPDSFTDEALAEAVEALCFDSGRRLDLGARARDFVRVELSPGRAAKAYYMAIERFAAATPPALDARAVSAAVAKLPNHGDDRTLFKLARDLAEQAPLRRPYRQLLVDVSALAREDLRTGIQRVVRAQLSALLADPPPGFRVEPVWLWETAGTTRYHYARRYTSRLLGIPEDALDDEVIEVSRGDVFFGADYFADGVTAAARSGTYTGWRASGVSISFVVYDILPLTFPHFFPDFAEDVHAQWLSAIADASDNLICISDAVAEDVRRWLDTHKPAALEKARICSVHLGADIDASAPTTGLPADAGSTLDAIAIRPTFLMVGTIEPRKGYLQVLGAFEALWRKGLDIGLVIVGGEGWKPLALPQRRTIPEIVGKLRDHPEAGRRLFWLQGVSDEYLQKIYAASVCLIAASEDEGFGLPLIEAARHSVPILARDIRVFREVAGRHASYFSGMAPSDIADALEQWLHAHAAESHQASGSMSWLTWADNVDRLKAVLLGVDGAEPLPGDSARRDGTTGAEQAL